MCAAAFCSTIMSQDTEPFRSLQKKKAAASCSQTGVLDGRNAGQDVQGCVKRAEHSMWRGLHHTMWHADRQCNMQMNKPLWIVEDTELMKSPEGRRKLQDAANDHVRLQIIHGADFGKVSMLTPSFASLLYVCLECVPV